MKYSDVVKAVAKEAQCSQSTAKQVLDGLCSVVIDNVGNEEIVLNRVGKLQVKTRSARSGKNPFTGKPMQVPETKTVVLKVAKELKDSLNA